ncbi:ASKHA domain-containing protein [Treponema primitia]|uniref:ASKHA domain-containing protein n=1 Tax=Treponema primitia TaxID=88058 RepID=UPI0002554D39|nr:ASKHA domain-containing protein [Treponema primitia]
MGSSFPQITVQLADKNQIIPLTEGSDLLSALRSAGVYVPAICGGRGTCGKCRIKVISGNLEPQPADLTFFSPADIKAGFRLACNTLPREDISILIPDTGEQSFHALNSFDLGSIGVSNAIAPQRVILERSPLSFARQLAESRAGRISLKELTEISRCADMAAAVAAAPVPANGSPAPVNEVWLYHDKGTILAVRDKPNEIYGIAIDIGTTTIALALVDLQKGTIKGRVSMVNKQREFGADVISRIQRANKGDLSLLSGSVRAQISAGIKELCRDAGIASADVCKVAVAANTTMLHLLLALSCNTLGTFPFTPVTLDFVTCTFGELFEGDLSCDITILPGISTYVGADISAGIYFTEMYTSPEPSLLMDIGTNGEMVLAFDGKLLCAATAAGPAFEGGNIQWGTGSVPGAISSVKYRDGKFDIKTIADSPPVGICGSGVVDVIWESLKNGLIQESGRFDKTVPASGLFLAQTKDGQDINFCQKDIRELQLAKSAICSGIDAMVRHTGLTYADIKNVYIAGGFGYNLNFSSGAGIGLIPPPLQPKIKLIGNSALGGTVKYLLQRDSVEAMNTIIALASEYSLPEDSYFNTIFIENINFEAGGS